MKTKAEILSEKTGIDLHELEFKNEVQIVRPSEALEAMDEYAQQIAQKFAEFVNLKLEADCNPENGKWYYFLGGNEWYSTTSELYAKFMEERNNPAPDIEG